MKIKVITPGFGFGEYEPMKCVAVRAGTKTVVIETGAFAPDFYFPKAKKGWAPMEPSRSHSGDFDVTEIEV